ncbi:uncharacterized protein LOC113470228 [Diaphorina citri]|uniref:Uncharacterized protein LOC113470228 n=1 Tax=Diaphorina citri TaxID=121845 RepID=A0A3Q0J748_DIACI|nr:uncharacterized protein LOC113470228 [Diaphorina citri]
MVGVSLVTLAFSFISVIRNQSLVLWRRLELSLLPSSYLLPYVQFVTLRKGATLQEKMEFLKEALLMSNFKHEHILRLIGVCLDNNPTLIIMELMEGKDLLSYLRSHRPTKVNVAILLKILNGGTSVASENPKSPISAPQKKSFYVRGILEQEDEFFKIMMITMQYAPRQDGGRGLVNIKLMCMKLEINMEKRLRASQDKTMKKIIEVDKKFTPLNLTTETTPKNVMGKEQLKRTVEIKSSSWEIS